jgi:hypothetical protein
MNAAGVMRRAAASVSLVAVAVWLGGLLALGAIAAPVVFSMVSMPSSADAMTIVFRRFDQVAMACAALVLASEAVGALARVGREPATRRRFAPVDGARAAVGVAAAALAVFEGTHVSPRIAALHAGGAIRGLGAAGQELSHLHDIAQLCAKTEIVLLVALVVLHVVALTRGRDGRHPRQTSVDSVDPVEG